MISMIEVLGYRCLRYISRPLNSFHILVGPNASGKTTFLDVIAFLEQLITEGVESAVFERTRNFHDLLWNRTGDRFELAIEATIPRSLCSRLRNVDYKVVRYEVTIGLDTNTQEIAILAEKVLLKEDTSTEQIQRPLFPMDPAPPRTIMTAKGVKGTRTIINKVYGGNDNFYSEVYQDTGKGWAPTFKFGPRKSALGNLPEDNTKFPVAIWLKGLLSNGVQQIVLNSMLIRKASPPGQIRGFKPDGSNLPWVIENLKQKSPDRFRDWVAHLQTALPDIENLLTIERNDDKHRYLVIRYKGGLEVPSWVASDGTLRLLALTLPAYLSDFEGVYLIEEPENGIHPRAVETMFQSLSSVYDAQILLATHSPVILSVGEARDVLCFAKTEQGSTDIVSGDNHPALKEWRGETNLGVLFAGGVLG